MKTLALAKLILGLGISAFAELPKAEPAMVCPVAPDSEPQIVSFFGARMEGHRRAAFHGGLDFTARENAPILAVADGEVVISRETQGSSGYLVVIDHGAGIHTRYEDLQSVSVKTGDQVRQGRAIGLMGHSARTGRRQLHFGVLRNGKFVDPLPFVEPPCRVSVS